MWLKDFANVLRELYPGYNIKSKEFPYCTVKLASMFDDSVKVVVPYWGKQLQMENGRSKEVLQIKYRDIVETLREGAESMIDAGLIADKRKKGK